MRTVQLPGPVWAALEAHLKHEGLIPDLPSSEDTMVVLGGLEIRKRPGSQSVGDFTVSSLVSASTSEGRVELSLNGERAQLDLDKAREIVRLLQGAIEAAISDQLMTQFLRDKVGLDEGRVTVALQDFREMRQGTRGTARPS